MNLQDDHKRQFALGLKYLYDSQKELNQAGVAMAAGVSAPTMTAIMRGYEDKFPGFENQRKIARVFGKEVHEVVEIGRKIDLGEALDPIRDALKQQTESTQCDTKSLCDEVPEAVRDLADLIKNNIVELSGISQEKLWDVAKYVHGLLINEKKRISNGIVSDRRVKERRSNDNKSGTCPVKDRRRKGDRRGTPTG